MSILIKGMEMPKSCWDCFACHDGWCIINQKIEGHRTVTHSCPLIELQPHGRLIDADAINWVEGRDEQDRPVYLLLKVQIDEIPTVIPAEEDK